jgi:hypothetical protein
MITSQTINIALESSGLNYKISSILISISQGDINFGGNQRYSIKTNINVQLPSTVKTYSGNPGYQFGKPLVMNNSANSFSLYQIADSSGNCVNSGSTATSVLFGQNSVYSCVSSNPCSSTLYIDSIIKQTGLLIQKWASGSTSTVSVGGTSSTANSCKSQTLVWNIMYTEAGWVADKQNYIIGSQMIR